MSTVRDMMLQTLAPEQWKPRQAVRKDQNDVVEHDEAAEEQAASRAAAPPPKQTAPAPAEKASKGRPRTGWLASSQGDASASGTQETKPQGGFLAHGQETTGGDETKDQTAARIKREKAAWAEQDQKDKATQAAMAEHAAQMRETIAPTHMPLIQVQWKAQQDMQKMDLDKEVNESDTQTRLESVSKQVQELQFEASRSGNSWEYTHRMLSQTKSLVGDHLSDLSGIRQRFAEKMNEYAGHEDITGELQSKMDEVGQRQATMEDYYKVLSQLEGRNAGTAGLAAFANRASTVDTAVADSAESIRKSRRQQEKREVA